MFSGRSSSRKYLIRSRGRRGLSLTDLLVVLYLLLLSVPIDHSKGTKTSKEGGGVQVFWRCEG